MTGRTGAGLRTRWRAATFLLTAAGAIAVLVIGIYREEIGEVLFNAAML